MTKGYGIKTSKGKSGTHMGKPGMSTGKNAQLGKASIGKMK